MMSYEMNSSSTCASLPFHYAHTKSNSQFPFSYRRPLSTIPDATIPPSVTKVAAKDSSLVELMCCCYDPNAVDELVEEAIGGASAAKSFRQSDEKGFYESETEVLRQLSSMGRLVVCAGNGAVQNSTNLALLRHGISLWLDVPLDIVARNVIEDQGQFASLEISTSESYPEIMNELGALYNKYKDGYATADVIISLQKIATRLGCDNLDDITREEMTFEALVEIEKLTRVKKLMEEAARPF